MLKLLTTALVALLGIAGAPFGSSLDSSVCAGSQAFCQGLHGTRLSAAAPGGAPAYKYLFNNIGGETLHVSADDLLNGTAGIGTPWTIFGAPTLVPKTGSAPKRDGVTGFDAGDYFRHASFALAGPGYVLCMAVNAASTGTNDRLFGNGGGSTGFEIIDWTAFTAAASISDYGSSGYAWSYTNWVGGGFHFVCFGYDLSAGQFNVQVDGTAGATSGNSGEATSTDPGTSSHSFIGGNGQSGEWWTVGTIYEVYLNPTINATAANLTAAYNGAIANE